jgi:CheY-like chemotaxis protein
MNNQTTALVVDSDRGQRDTICHALEGEGLHVLVTDNQYAALDRIERLEIDVLIAPLKADRIDGLKLLEAAYGRNPDVGVIFTTAANVLETDTGIKATLHHKSSFFSTEATQTRSPESISAQDTRNSPPYPRESSIKVPD